MKLETTFIGMSSEPPERAGATGPPAFSEAHGTLRGEAALRQDPLPPSDPPGLIDWVNSAAARPYEGKWVLLTRDHAVIDADSSPSALLERHTQVISPLVVFVQPADATLAV
jgi:hypothetical protein